MQVNSRVRRTLFLSIILILVSALSFAALPAPTGYVSDFAQVITSSQELEIEAVAKALDDSGNIEIAIVTVESMEGNSIEEYSYELADAWGIGDSQEDTGLLFLLAVEERQVRIEVGYGLEGDLPDGLVGRILDSYVLPPFKNGDFSEGMAEGTKAIAATLAEKRDFTLEISDIESYASSESDDSLEDIIGSIFTVIFVIFMIFGRMRLWPLLFLGSSRRGRSYGGGFGSSGRGGGFGGGGFGGFSGGGFGGGGASRGF